MDTVENVSVRVARGLAWIKENGHLVGFDLNRVDLDSLDVSSGHRCVTAQASGTGDYRVAADLLEDQLAIDPHEWGRRHGVLPERSWPEWTLDQRRVDEDALTAEWVRVLTAERAAGRV